MDGFKEFQGKDLDAAIQDACLYFNASRERLEIELLQDAKSGIFGIVGARKAKIRARRASLRDTVQSVLGELSGHTARASGRAKERRDRAPDPARRSALQQDAEPDREAARGSEQGSSRGSSLNSASPRTARSRQESGILRPQGQTARNRTERRACADAPSAASAASVSSEVVNKSEHPVEQRFVPGQERSPSVRPTDAQPVETGNALCEDGLNHRPLDRQDLPLLEAPALQILHVLLAPLTEERPRLMPDIVNGAFSVRVQGVSDPSLLIGRDGATLMALQHLTSRLVSRAVQRGVHVLLEVESFREQQEEELRQLAKSLAARVRETGKSQSTRPLRSSQRRIVHLCLREMDDIQTRSTGAGDLKRVLIFPRKTLARPKDQAQSTPQA